MPAALRNGRRQVLRSRLKGRRAPTPRVVSQYSREPRRRSTSRDQEDERAGQDNGGRGTPPTLEKGARILAALRRLSAQDRARDTGGRAGSSPLGYVVADGRSDGISLFRTASSLCPRNSGSHAPSPLTERH